MNKNFSVSGWNEQSGRGFCFIRDIRKIRLPQAFGMRPGRMEVLRGKRNGSEEKEKAVRRQNQNAV
jgi:hypothetical protein